MDDFIVIAVLVLVIGGAVIYVLKQRKKGVKCIGCPNSGSCSGSCCNCNADNK
jgi:prolipoprotein diacylglyceryltransferase